MAANKGSTPYPASGQLLSMRRVLPILSPLLKPRPSPILQVRILETSHSAAVPRKTYQTQQPSQKPGTACYHLRDDFQYGEMADDLRSVELGVFLDFFDRVTRSSLFDHSLLKQTTFYRSQSRFTDNDDRLGVERCSIRHCSLMA